MHEYNGLPGCVLKKSSSSVSCSADPRRCAAALSKPVLGREVGAPDWIRYPSLANAAGLLGLHAGSISKSCRDTIRHTGGYEFQYAEVETAEQLPGEEWRDMILPARVKLNKN